MTDLTHNSLATLTFENFDPPWFWLLAIAVSIGILVGTYRGIRRRSGRNLAWALLTLRILGVAALFIALIKPEWKSHQLRVRNRNGEKFGRITVEPQQATYPPGTKVTLTATPQPGYAFLRWQGDVQGKAAQITITMNAHRHVVGEFVAIEAKK